MHNGSSARALMRRVRIVAAGMVVVSLLGWSVVPSKVDAHLAVPDLSMWGPFGKPTLRCLRALGMATRRCFNQVLTVHRQCLDSRLAGQVCDQSQRDTQIAAIEQTAQGMVATACLGGQLTELRFSSFDEARADVLRGCGDQAAAAVSVLYSQSVAAGVSPAEQRCRSRVAASSQKFIEFAIRLKFRALERIAVRYPPPSKRIALMHAVTARVTAMQERLIARLAQECPDLQRVYQRDTTSLIAALEVRASCVVSATYIQGGLNGVLCPQPVCGNGIKETGEQCDDGNRVDADTCSNACGILP